jgi:hypothetical protein
MQQAIYPLVPVICDDAEFAEAYNDDLMSSLYQSQCMQANEVQKLAQQGVKFDQLVFINSESNDLVNKFKFDGLWSEEFMPEIVHVNVDETTKAAVSEVHRAIQNVIYNRGTG